MNLKVRMSRRSCTGSPSVGFECTRQRTSRRITRTELICSADTDVNLDYTAFRRSCNSLPPLWTIVGTKPNASALLFQKNDKGNALGASDKWLIRVIRLRDFRFAAISAAFIWRGVVEIVGVLLSRAAQITCVNDAPTTIVYERCDHTSRRCERAVCPSDFSSAAQGLSQLRYLRIAAGERRAQQVSHRARNLIPRFRRDGEIFGHLIGP